MENLNLKNLTGRILLKKEYQVTGHSLWDSRKWGGLIG